VAEQTCSGDSTRDAVPSGTGRPHGGCLVQITHTSALGGPLCKVAGDHIPSSPRVAQFSALLDDVLGRARERDDVDVGRIELCCPPGDRIVSRVPLRKAEDRGTILGNKLRATQSRSARLRSLEISAFA
jgi:hypothetical protein